MHDLSLHQSRFNDLTSQRIYFRDQDLRLISANQAYLDDICCARLEDVLGTRLKDSSRQHDGIERLLMEVEDQISQTHESQVRNHVRCKTDANDSTVSLECHPVFSNDGKFRGIACRYNVEDMFESLGFEKMLMDSLMRSTQDRIYFKDLESRFMRVSHSMIDVFGVSDLETIIGSTDFDFWDFDCAQGFFQSERRIIETREPLIGVCEEEIRSDGKRSWVITSKMPLEDEFGNVYGTFGISKDITDLKETEAQLQDTNRQLVTASRRAGMAEIASNVIHNVGNVLNSLNVSLSVSRNMVKNSGIENLVKASDLLERNKNTPEFLSQHPKGKALPDFLRMSAEYLTKMQTNLAEELDSLGRNVDHIKNIVSMQQEYAGSGLVIETVELSSLVQDAIQIGQCTLGESEVEISKQINIDIEVETDKHRVLQILVNLIRNAMHACQDTDQEEPKQIQITASQPTDAFFMIDVSDNGIGIEPGNLTSIFNHGFTTKESGKGFGLHSCANVAKELGGSLIAVSSGIGTGATFSLNLPVKSVSKNTTKVRSDVVTIGMHDTITTNTLIGSKD
jgi:PAS domain S-box-containing protein